MPLTELVIKTVKPTAKAQKLTDADGLYLFVLPSGTKSWRMDYSFAGKRFTYTFGKYPQLTLARARLKRGEIKQKLHDGINPSTEKRARKAAEHVLIKETFSDIADDWYSSKSDNRSKAWREANKLYLERDLKPLLGKLAIRDVDARSLLTVLEQCGKERGIKTADRVRQTALQVFEYAILKFKVDNNPAAKLKRWAEIPPVTNRPHLVEHEIHDLVNAIDAYPGYLTTKLAAKLLLLTFVRKTELVEAKWTEFDLVNAKWTIPAERMKMKDSHVVPLSLQTLQTLETLRPLSCGSDYLFPKNSTILKPINRATLNNMFANMENGKYAGKFSPHGIRGTASTWLNERSFRHDAIERQLAHSERNQVRASYNHADYMLERRQMMQAWADFLFPTHTPVIESVK